jgi:hypothetical protein
MAGAPARATQEQGHLAMGHVGSVYRGRPVGAVLLVLAGPGDLVRAKSNELASAAGLSAARTSTPRESDKAHTSNPVLVDHYLNWLGGGASTEGGALHRGGCVSLKLALPSPAPACRNDRPCRELPANRQQKLAQSSLLPTGGGSASDAPDVQPASLPTPIPSAKRKRSMGAPRAAALRSSSLKKVSKPGCVAFFFHKIMVFHN